MLILAMSGRALAASARRAGYAPLVADRFADDDTRALADGVATVAACADGMLEPTSAMAALEALAGNGPVTGIVYGSGLEHMPDVIDAIARRWRLLGNDGATVRAVKDPGGFAALCRACEIPHPEIASARPADAEGWLVKRVGGAGGGHVLPASGPQDRTGVYFQRFVAGRAVSVLFAADERKAHCIGISEQWVAPTPARPYRYAGAAQPADVEPSTALKLREAVDRLVAQTSLRGLNSADFILSPASADAASNAWCLEVNPRPGATLDIFDTHVLSLFELHVEACHGRLAASPLGANGDSAAAAEIVFAEADIARFPKLAWQDWARDRQPCGSSVARHDPVCTVVAHAPTKDLAIIRLRAHKAAVMSELGRAP